MKPDSEKLSKRQRAIKIIIAYPFVLLLIAIVINMFMWNVKPYEVSLPSIESIRALIIAAVLLIINHSWLMTVTELTRVRHKMYSTPEEWSANEMQPEDAPVEGVRELKRCHDTHLNNTENIIYFILLCSIFIFGTPSILATEILIIGYAVSRVGYTYSFLSGKDGVRGIFMSLSLIAMYSMLCYLVMSLFI